ncbi:uncharacterized protein LOC135471320 [Liolophura sinensis]|uniref:uncharacterized protein LOC135471320 n=1 Tax=Liolophura sinensis TaxID=3198878 RepID=UPI003158A016
MRLELNTKWWRNICQYGQQSNIPRDKKTSPEGGEKVILPEDYPGWFVHLRSVSGGVRCFENVSDLASSKVKAFVTGSNVAGLQVTPLQMGKVEHKPRHFLPGTVFWAEKIYVGKVRVDAGVKFLLFRKTKLQDVKYLKCRDVQNRDILLAMDKVGKFFEISPVLTQNNTAEKYVFNTEDLFSLKQIISPVMLIHGQIPRVDNFSGILHLQRKFLDKTVVAATNIDRNNHVVLEIAVASSTTYHMALNSKDAIKNGDMGGALKHCRRKADQFMQRIRVPFAMSQEEMHEVDSPNDSVELEEEELMSRKLTAITESIEEEGDEELSEENKENILANSYSIDTAKNTNDKSTLLNNANKPTNGNETPTVYEQNVDTDDEMTEESEKPINIITDQTHNDINDNINANDVACLRTNDVENEKTMTVTVEEKLINLNCMSEVMLCSTTTEVPITEADESRNGLSDNSDEVDSDKNKMVDSDSGDDADSGISDKHVTCL